MEKIFKNFGKWSPKKINCVNRQQKKSVNSVKGSEIMPHKLYGKKSRISWEDHEKTWISPIFQLSLHPFYRWIRGKAYYIKECLRKNANFVKKPRKNITEKFISSKDKNKMQILSKCWGKKAKFVKRLHK